MTITDPNTQQKTTEQINAILAEAHNEPPIRLTLLARIDATIRHWLAGRQAFIFLHRVARDES